MKKTTFFKSLLVAAGLLVGTSGAWADDWSTVWKADFSSAPSGMTYSVSNGSVDISTGVLFYHQGGGSGDRAINTAFTADAFKVSSNWQMEFDWGASSANKNPSNVTFATNNGAAFTLTWASYATTAVITDANSTELANNLPIEGYNKATMTNLSHFVITGDTENGIYLTVTNGGTTYVNNVLVSSTFGYPATFNGSLGRAVSHMALDNIVFKTPAVAGFVPAPSHTLTGAVGAQRKFTLSCLDADAVIYYSESELTADASGWISYTGEVTTSAAKIWAVAKKGSDASEVYSFETGAGSAITLNVPGVFVADFTSASQVVLNASYNKAGVQFEPEATLAATFTNNAGVATNVTLPFTVTENGTLTVTASAEGFTSREASMPVYGQYTQTWQSIDFSAVTEANIAEQMGEAWAKQEGTGRWASWTADKEPYTYYEHTGEGVHNVTLDKLKFRSVVILNMGYGLSRNVSGSEAISVINTKAGEIVAFEVYNGFGADVVKGTNTFMSYVLNAGSDPSLGANNGTVLVQATIYSPNSVSTTIGTTGYSTYASAFALDLDNISGATAYYASAVADGKVTLSEATGTVVAGTGLILKGTAGAEVTIPVAQTGSKIDGNLLVGCLVATDVAQDANSYVLVNNGGTAEFESLANMGATIPAGKAYLKVPAADGARLSIVFDTTTGISTVAAQSVENDAVYNLQGQRVVNAQKGLFIINGKKVVLK